MANVLYLAEVNLGGRLGRTFIETDRDTNSREHVVSLIRNRDIDPVKVLEVDEDAGTCRDVTDELICEAGLNDYTTHLTPSDRLAWLHDRARDERKVH